MFFIVAPPGPEDTSQKYSHRLARNVMGVTHRRFSAAAGDRPCWSSGFGQIARLCGDGCTVAHADVD
jgi:hypothetical protein